MKMPYRNASRASASTVGVVEQVVGQGLELEQVVVVRQLAGQERVQVAAPLDGRVAVDGEALGGGAPLGLQQRRQELQREVDHVRHTRRADRAVQLRQV